MIGVILQFFCLFLVTISKGIAFNHQQKCLINGICGSSDIKSKYFGPKKLKRFEKFDKEAFKCDKRVCIKISL